MDVLQVTTHERTHVRTVGLPQVSRTRVALTADGDVELAGDLVGACRLPCEDGRARVALAAPPAPAGGDLRIEVDVAPGRALEIVESTVTGTHDVHGPRTTWLADVRLGRGSVLVWPSLPVVVGEGADVLRLMHVDLAPGARVVLRETLVTGRAGRTTGRIRSTIRARLGDRPLLAETFVAEPASALLGAPHPALVGPATGDRHLDTLVVLGVRLDDPDALQLEHEGSMLRGPAARAHDHDLVQLLAPAG